MNVLRGLAAFLIATSIGGAIISGGLGSAKHIQPAGWVAAGFGAVLVLTVATCVAVSVYREGF